MNGDHDRSWSSSSSSSSSSWSRWWNGAERGKKRGGGGNPYPLTRRRLPSLPSSVVAATASRRGIVARSPVDFQRVASRSACYRSAPATPCCYCCYCCCYSADRYLRKSLLPLIWIVDRDCRHNFFLSFFFFFAWYETRARKRCCDLISLSLSHTLSLTLSLILSSLFPFRFIRYIEIDRCVDRCIYIRYKKSDVFIILL